MDWTDIRHDLVSNLVNLTLPVVLAWAVPLLREAAAHVRLGRAEKLARILVRATQQTMLKPDRILQGKAMVMTALRVRFPGLAGDVLEALIESAVAQIKVEEVR